MVIFLKLVAAVLLWAVLYTLTPDFGDRVIDGLVPLMLGAAAVILVFWLPLPRRPKAVPFDSGTRG